MINEVILSTMNIATKDRITWKLLNVATFLHDTPHLFLVSTDTLDAYAYRFYMSMFIYIYEVYMYIPACIIVIINKIH